MGSLFGSSGPSARDIARQEEKARLAEVERLRIAEQKLRRRESKETMQGQGIATPENIMLGSDTAAESTGAEEAMGTLAKPMEVKDPIITEREKAMEALKGKFKVNGFGGVRF
jgi:hypothetical protein